MHGLGTDGLELVLHNKNTHDDQHRTTKPGLRVLVAEMETSRACGDPGRFRVLVVMIEDQHKKTIQSLCQDRQRSE